MGALLGCFFSFSFLESLYFFFIMEGGCIARLVLGVSLKSLLFIEGGCSLFPVYFHQVLLGVGC